MKASLDYVDLGRIRRGLLRTIKTLDGTDTAEYARETLEKIDRMREELNEFDLDPARADVRVCPR